MPRIPDVPALLATWRTWPWHLIFASGLVLVIPGLLFRPVGFAGLALSLLVTAVLSAVLIAVTINQDRQTAEFPDTAVSESSDPAPDAEPHPRPVSDADWAAFVYNDVPENTW